MRLTRLRARAPIVLAVAAGAALIAACVDALAPRNGAIVILVALAQLPAAGALGPPDSVLWGARLDAERRTRTPANHSARSGNLRAEVSIPRGAQAELAPAGHLQWARARAIGPMNKTVDLCQVVQGGLECGIGPDWSAVPRALSFRGTIDGLSPGSYTVSVEGLVANEVDYFGQASNVTVTLGATTTATILFNSFIPTVAALPSPTTATALVASITPVTGATSYTVEVARDTAFTSPRAATTAAITVTVSLPDTGTFHVRFRSVNPNTVSQGRPSVRQTVRVLRDRFEPANDTRSGAPSLGFGTQANGTYSDLNILPVGDVDWFTVGACLGDTLTATASAVRLSPASQLNSVLRIYNPSDSLLDSNDNADSTDARTQTVIAGSGSHAIQVSGSASSTGHYQLMIQVSPGPNSGSTACTR